MTAREWMGEIRQARDEERADCAREIERLEVIVH
jgi:hypothetical protein